MQAQLTPAEAAVGEQQRRYVSMEALPPGAHADSCCGWLSSLLRRAAGDEPEPPPMRRAPRCVGAWEGCGGRGGANMYMCGTHPPTYSGPKHRRSRTRPAPSRRATPLEPHQFGQQHYQHYQAPPVASPGTCHREGTAEEELMEAENGRLLPKVRGRGVFRRNTAPPRRR